jgi:hypothetical protein
MDLWKLIKQVTEFPFLAVLLPLLLILYITNKKKLTGLYVGRDAILQPTLSLERKVKHFIF